MSRKSGNRFSEKDMRKLKKAKTRFPQNRSTHGRTSISHAQALRG